MFTPGLSRILSVEIQIVLGRILSPSILTNRGL